MPLAAHAVFSGEYLHLEAAWGEPEGAGKLVRAQGTASVADLAQAAQLGEQVAAQLRAGGAH
jgi:hydroxymethylbilane synthase